MKVCYAPCIPHTCFVHSCGHLQGGALERIHIEVLQKLMETMHRYEILNSKMF
jgi:hypothetical protein